ncbi:GNAT family N-acetyltransferase [Clostridium sp. 1001271B_151109_B4]|uniref:GNAT family N-acetyltransferase n=1 Tax=Clostridium sp. 1001271B_151109_B4 TaxID=2787148 RepID=UPI0018A97BFD|nr:GNAT family N-acetyltransferase [Clostridium sp. 1001271B_151109_B4]
MNIRIAKAEDAKELLEIYKYYVENTTITFEYETPTVKEFENRIKNTLVRYPYLVAEDNNKICGYAYANAFKGRRAYDWSVETSIYIQNDNSRSGIGTLLYNELERYLKLQNIININACITYPNKQSENFHKKFGYKTVAHFNKCGYKFGQWKDVVWMEKFIGDHVDNPANLIPFSKL